MKTSNCDFRQGVLTPAVQLALLAMFAAAPGWAAAQTAPAADAAPAPDPQAQTQTAQQNADEASETIGEGQAHLHALICPENYFELGAQGASRSSTKFGEYNGMPYRGPYGVGNFNLAGGDGYCQGGGAMRWQFTGTDVFTNSRTLSATAGVQGQWSLGLMFDQLRHYTTTGYQTPFLGGGGNVLTLPSNFGVINTGVNGGSRSLTPTQLAAFNDVNVNNTRKNFTLTGGYNINNEWDVKLNFKHIDRSGAKLIGGGTDLIDMTAASGYNFAGEASGLRMNPTNDRTEQISLSANWVGEKAYASFEYYGSLYHADYLGLSFANPFVTGAGAPATGTVLAGGLPMDTMSLPPSNLLNQLNVTGGYVFSRQTKLSGGLSLGLNTQNSSFLNTFTTNPMTVTSLPRNSLDGRVVNTHADARLTHQFTPALGLNTGFRFDNRDNRTPVATYSYYTLAGDGITPSIVSPTNAPMSLRHTVADATLDYRLSKTQRVSLGYTYDHMQRWCSSDIAANTQGLIANPSAYYVDGASCAQVPRSTDNSLSLNYKLSLSDTVRVGAGYTFADRDATISSFYNPMQAYPQGYPNYGWLAYFQAPRREHVLKLRTDWQVTPSLDLGLTGQYTYDDYTQSTLGIQNGHAGNINFDATYQVSDNMSYGFYASWQKRSLYHLNSSDHSPTAPVNTLWSNHLSDSDIDIGITGKQKFMHDKFQLTEDLSYNYGRSAYGTALVANIAPAVGNSGNVPPITNKIIQFRLVGSYQIDKKSRINVGYVFQRILSSDYMYNGYAYGYTPSGMMPANLRSPNYKLHVLFVTYRYTF